MPPHLLEAGRGRDTEGVTSMHDDLTLPDGAVRLPLRARDGSVRAYAIVDAADAPVVSQYRWHFERRYAVRDVGGRRQKRKIYLHRQILGLVPGDGLEGDHRDRDRLNCRRSNLRIVPGMSANRQNLPGQRNTSSAYRGVSFYKRDGTWQAYLRAKGKRVHLGYFETELGAAEAARAARLRLMPYAVD